jgi:hypothetical protein
MSDEDRTSEERIVVHHESIKQAVRPSIRGSPQKRSEDSRHARTVGDRGPVAGVARSVPQGCMPESNLRPPAGWARLITCFGTDAATCPTLAMPAGFAACRRTGERRLMTLKEPP